MRRAGDEDRRQRFAVDISVVGGHIVGDYIVGSRRSRARWIDRELIIGGRRRVVQRLDDDIGRGNCLLAVADGLVGERIAAVEVGFRREAKAAIGIERQRAISRPCDDLSRQRPPSGLTSLASTPRSALTISGTSSPVL